MRSEHQISLVWTRAQDVCRWQAWVCYCTWQLRLRGNVTQSASSLSAPKNSVSKESDSWLGLLSTYVQIVCLATSSVMYFLVCNSFNNGSWWPPTDLVIELAGFMLWGTHLSLPRQADKDSLMIAVSNALLSSSPWLCSEFKASNKLFASITQRPWGSR